MKLGRTLGKELGQGTKVIYASRLSKQVVETGAEAVGDSEDVATSRSKSLMQLPDWIVVRGIACLKSSRCR